MTSTTRTDRLQALSEANGATFDPLSYSEYGSKLSFGSPMSLLQHSPFMPYGDCEFSITAAGVVDAVDG